MLHHSIPKPTQVVILGQRGDLYVHTRHHEVSEAPHHAPPKYYLTPPRFSLALSPTYTNAAGELVTEHICPKHPGRMDINDRPPRPTSGRFPEILPLSDEESPEPPAYYVPLAADPAIDYDRLQDRRRAANEYDLKRIETEARRKAGKGSKKGSKKTAVEEKAAVEEETAVEEEIAVEGGAAARKREQEV